MFGCMCIPLLYFDDRLPSPAEYDGGEREREREREREIPVYL